MNREDASYARERLKPFRQVLDDFDAALEYAGNVEEEHKTLKSEIPKLKAERDQLQKEVEAKKAAVEQAINDHDAQVRAMTKSYDQARTAAEQQINELNGRVLSGELAHKTRMADMEKEFQARATILKTVIDELEKKQATLTATVKKSKEAVLGL